MTGKSKKRKTLRKRLSICAWMVAGLFVVIFIRYFYLHIIQADALQEKVVEQRIRSTVLEPERGKIMDRNGNILAMSLMAQDISVNPNVIHGSNVEKASVLLSDTLEIPLEEVRDIVASDKNWVPIAKRVDPDIAYRIKTENIYGIEILPSPKRYYPNGITGSTFLGAINHNNDPVSGVELSLNDYLSGTPGYNISEVSSKGDEIPIGFKNISTPQNGQDVQLTIDSYIQYVLEKRLEQAVEELEPSAIHGIVMDPNNGEILAMASYPTFDPNDYSTYDPKTWTNAPHAWTYEPGSIFKPVFMAMALNEGHITPHFTYQDKGTINVNGSTLKNWNGQGLGTANLEDVIVHSSNVGMVTISHQMTGKELVEGLHKAGFGQKTGIELPGEEIGLFPRANKDKDDFNNINNDPIRKATISFGQGISVTPMQLITATSEVINGGYDIAPQILYPIIDEEENPLYIPTIPEKKRIYSKETSELIKSYMEANMLKGSGKPFQIEGHKSGGKTGSAWFIDPETRQYKDGAIIGSFLGFAPLDHPEYILLISVQEPKGREFGGETAGPIFQDVMTEILRYRSVPKENEPAPVTYDIPDTNWLLLEDATRIIEEHVPSAVVENAGDGEVVVGAHYTYRKKQLHVTFETKRIVEDSLYYLPSLLGKTKEEVVQLLSPYDIELTVHGNGTVFEQTTPPGKRSQKDMNHFSVWLQ